MSRFKIYLSTFLLLTAFFCSGFQSSQYYIPKEDSDFFKISVKIMNFEKTSGGSGGILRSDKTGSEILTNRHVCKLIEHGGIVEDSEHIDHMVVSYKESESHDLCLIKIAENLNINLKIAHKAPKLGEPSIVVGHPNLLPTLVTRGSFSEKMVIDLQDGSRDCTEDELKDPRMGIFCALFGRLPVIIQREAILTSSIIQAGSSGSPVFNSKGELAAVIFAGSGEMSWGYAVPLESIWQFMADTRSMEWSLAK